ncbi:MAG TPA: 50S ribosomal protein L11 methyltransferase [Solirubrobacteraceae bacterium]|nr:50S ribosomal protein L11 methyltransferase [Solirubrobacteraceae bacterium]
MIRLAVRVQDEHAELVLAELLELTPAGVEEVRGQPGTGAAGTVEYAVYGAPGELPGLPAVHAVAGDALVEVSTSEIPDDWHERWKQFHTPVLVRAPRPAGGRCAPVPSLRVRPPWEAAHAHEHGELQEIVIDPGQAFGTGGHASTRLCLELLLALAAHEPARGPVLDLGTGSGVLAIAASALGFLPVLALDNEPESVAAARENALANGATIDVRRYDLRTHELVLPATATLVLANLLRPLLLELTSGLQRAPTHLIAGGLLRDEVDEVAGEFARRVGLHERERRARGEWAAVWLTSR